MAVTRKKMQIYGTKSIKLKSKNNAKILIFPFFFGGGE